MNTNRPHFPIGTLTLNGQLILAAGAKHPEFAVRLQDGYLAATAAVLAKIPADLSGQKAAKGELAALTKAQAEKLDKLTYAMNQARATAKLAFPGETVKLREEFQVGAQEHNDLGSILTRADIIIASLQTETNAPAIKAKGWIEADTTALASLRDTFPKSIEIKQQTHSGGKAATEVKDADVSNLYERLLTIQNAANLHWPATNPENTRIRDEFRLNTFPPAGGSSKPATPPSPAPAPSPTPPPQ